MTDNFNVIAGVVGVKIVRGRWLYLVKFESRINYGVGMVEKQMKETAFDLSYLNQYLLINPGLDVRIMELGRCMPMLVNGMHRSFNTKLKPMFKC